MADAADFARLFHSLPVGMYLGRFAPGGTSTRAANAHLKLIFGYAGEASDDGVRPFGPERFVDAHGFAALLERLGNDGVLTNYLVRLRRVDLSSVWVELTGRAEASGDGFDVELIVRDVGERKKLDDQTREIYHQLLQAEKMAALGQTISGVAHELNNPLASILTWAERLTQKAALEPSLQKGLETILSEAERAARIVRQLLTFARKRQTTRAMVDLNHVVRETLALRAYDQRVNNIVTIEALATGLPLVFADGYQVQQVLLNLVINAEQAMLSSHGRGVLVLRTWHDATRDVVALEINDDGPGVPDELQPKIFDPFFTTKEVGKGTGLGLAVAYGIVQEHGGRIKVESQAGGGASFFIELPVSGVPIDARPAPGAVPSRSTGSGGATVLLVEDEMALAVAVTDALRDAGYEVEHARDGGEALTRIEGRLFDVVICDLKMPRVDGPTFFRRMTATQPVMSTRVIFVTGDVAGTEAESFLEQSGCRWLAKPFRLNDLVKAVAKQLEDMRK